MPESAATIINTVPTTDTLVPTKMTANSHMDDLIKLVNRLQDALSSVSLNNPIDLPQIVVIGRYLSLSLCVCVLIMHCIYHDMIVSRVERVQCWRILWEETL